MNTVLTDSYLLVVQKKPVFLKRYFGYFLPGGLKTKEVLMSLNLLNIMSLLRVAIIKD